MGRVRNLSWVHWKQLFDALIQPLSKTWDMYDFLGMHNADPTAPKSFVHKPSLGKLIHQKLLNFGNRQCASTILYRIVEFYPTYTN